MNPSLPLLLPVQVQVSTSTMLARGRGTADQVSRLCAGLAHALAHAEALHARASEPGHVWFARACRCGAFVEQALPASVAQEVAASWARVHATPACGPRQRAAALELLVEHAARG